MNIQTYTQAMLDGYIPSSLIARDLEISANYFNKTVLERIVFKNVVLIKIPRESHEFISKAYTSILLESEESEEHYEHVLIISDTKKVGFWK